jgi:hypothetical protein
MRVAIDVLQQVIPEQWESVLDLLHRIHSSRRILSTIVKYVCELQADSR